MNTMENRTDENDLSKRKETLFLQKKNLVRQSLRKINTYRSRPF